MRRGSRLKYRVVRILAGPAGRRLRRLPPELKRRLTRRPHEVHAFLQVDDPYSYLLSLYLPALAAEFDVAVIPHLSQSLGGGYQPQPDMQAEYAIADCRRLARELGVPFLDRGDAPVVERRRALADFVAKEAAGERYPGRLYGALAAYWRGDSEAVSRLLGGFGGDGASGAVIEASQRLLDRLGHYGAAMLYYGGEWYWGVDRLLYLVDRLDAGGLARPGTGTSAFRAIRQTMQAGLPASVPASGRRLPAIRMFHSFRSPYSYLALERVCAIADAFGVRLDIRPVLPLVMRGTPMPRRKLLYILFDAAREAERRGIAFRRFFDPQPAGIERLMAVFHYARTERRERDFVLAAGRAIWNDGLDVTKDGVMRRIAHESGLFWPEVLQAMEDDGWREEAAASRDALSAAGLWGVPSFLFDDVALWGQDRDWLLAREIEDRCQDGEGILV